ncbi:unnamed protein product, partial [Closterium sp. NIES-54]
EEGVALLVQYVGHGASAWRATLLGLTTRLRSDRLRVTPSASDANTADIFTKALAPGDHQRFCTML